MLVEPRPFQLIEAHITINRLGFYDVYPAIDREEAIAMMTTTNRKYDLLICSSNLGKFELLKLIDQSGNMRLAENIMIIGHTDESWLTHTIIPIKEISSFCIMKRPLDLILLKKRISTLAC
ncbi:hypothetical protein PSEWESI4_03565 [Pseudomonas carbonaria]|uniref:Response regulator receiver domain-containing protein n=1 Tax=Zestomonas carbonaria TaxID=2762745 RepID=A0A7U7IAA7_9GAMM|nr:hypothetical protein PSEWESI4_03565 [Pseudomonas carbonaria]